MSFRGRKAAVRPTRHKVPVTTIETALHVVRQADQVMFMSLEPTAAEEWDEHPWRDHSLPLNIVSESRAIPVLPAEIVMWENSDDDSDVLYPHLQYTCPICKQTQNVDLYDTDTNPRLACCDVYSWKSLAWLGWIQPV